MNDQQPVSFPNCKAALAVAGGGTVAWTFDFLLPTADNFFVGWALAFLKPSTRGDRHVFAAKERKEDFER